MAATSVLAMAGVLGCAATPAPEQGVTPTRSPSSPPSTPSTPLPRLHALIDAPLTESTPPPAVSADYVFPIADCAVSYSAGHHDYPATDIFADRNCAVVAVTAGRVDEIGTEDRWSSATNLGADRGGRFVSVVGDDGVRYYGSHLESVAPDIAVGDVVAAGTVVGYVGDSGSAAGTGTHLHFGLSWPTSPGQWWVRRGVVDPAPLLADWQAGLDTSPADAVAAAHATLGELPSCVSYC